MAMGSVSAAPASSVYVDDDGSDCNDGLTATTAFQTIQKGLDTVANAGTVNIAPGTYTGKGNTNLDVKKDVTIKGAGPDKTIIDPRGRGNAFNINSGKTVKIQDVTIRRGNARDGGAINNKGKLTLTNVKFKDNNARNGGAIYNTGTLTVAGSTFQNNKAYCYGGAIWNSGTVTVTGSTFRNNRAHYGGAIYNNMGTLSIKYSAIVDNWRYDIYMNKGTLDARYNWWGTNFKWRDPLTSGKIKASISTLVPKASYAPWLILSIKADPTTVNRFGSSIITADIYKDSAGGNHKANFALYPKEIPIRFTTDLGSIGSRTVNKFLSSGVASVTLSAGYRAGIAHITARVDDQLVYTGVTIRGAMNPNWGYTHCSYMGMYTHCCRTAT